MKKINTRLGFFREYTIKGMWKGQTLTFLHKNGKHQSRLVVYFRSFVSKLTEEWSTQQYLRSK